MWAASPGRVNTMEEVVPVEFSKEAQLVVTSSEEAGIPVLWGCHVAQGSTPTTNPQLEMEPHSHRLKNPWP